MRILFMGSPDFAVPSLQQLVERGFDVCAVVSGPDKKRGRGNTLSPTPVKEKALELGIPVIEAEQMKDGAFQDALRAYSPDLLVVVAFKILPKKVLDIPTIGSVNLHASLLPKYRGAAPIHWAIVNGETETGNTIFFLDEKMDTGNIIAQKSLPIGENETTGDIYIKLMEQGAELVADTVAKIQQRTITPIPQNDDLACPAPKVFPEDAFIDFNETSTSVHNRIRGMNPFPGAWTWYSGQKLKIHASRNHPDIQLSKGDSNFSDGRLLIGCEGGCVELLEIQLPGKKRISAQEFVLGHDTKFIARQ